MINLIRHSVLLLLTLSIALGSVGVAIGQQLCQMVMVGSHEVPEKEMAGCCSESESSDSEDDCCTLEVTYKKLDLVSTAMVDVLKKVYLAYTAIIPQPAYELPVPAIIQAVLTFSDSSPPLSGRKILLLKRTLLV
ncbi:hypothetical protein H8S95_13140 [Pontibacter sp. KCTC 32443]|uniref:hypothetical protein n=1 Tax=Pontibacter TaxID=323449 RepID=UPI00164CF08F|nr:MULTISPECIES: hypothetical protein [Pontibacter]MBC5775015.1 hypothetical protein [Pontibacter sp. KCTC 32443]